MKRSLVPLLASATLFLVAGAFAVRAQTTGADASAATTAPATTTDNDAALRARLEKNPRFMQRADTDHDGKLSDAEWAAAKQQFKQWRKDGMQARQKMEMRKPCDCAKGRHFDPAAIKAFRRGWILGKYDKNGDGHLDAAERAAMKADMQAKMLDRMNKQFARLKAMDTNGDGQISADEFAAARAKFQADHKDGMGHHWHHGMAPGMMKGHGQGSDMAPPPPPPPPTDPDNE